MGEGLAIVGGDEELIISNEDGNDHTRCILLFCYFVIFYIL